MTEEETIPDKSRITREDIEQIFKLRYEHGMSPTDLASKYEVTRPYMSNILAARVRKQISWPLLLKYKNHNPELLDELNRLRKENQLLRHKLRVRIDSMARKVATRLAAK